MIRGLRRTTRAGGNAGLPPEDLGVRPGRPHRLTGNDVTNGYPDPIAAAITLLWEDELGKFGKRAAIRALIGQ